MSRLKLLMKELNESLSKLKKEESGETTAPLVSIAGVQWTPVSPIEEEDEEWVCAPFMLDQTSFASLGVESAKTRNACRKKQASI